MRVWLFCVAAVATIACHSSPTPGPRAQPANVVASNLLRADYAGSQACSDCHHEIYAKWESSPMRNMTRDAATATIRAPFDGATITVGDDSATMTTDRGGRFVTVNTARGTSRYRVTKVIGGRYREDFVGIDVTTAANPLTGGIGVERVLPATYVFSTSSWRYKGYSVMVTERPKLSVRAVWANDCIPCHNTMPGATLLYDELHGPGLPAYQGKLSDRVLPRSLTWTVRSRDDAQLTRMLNDEIALLGGAPPDDGSLRSTLQAAATASHQHLDGSHLVELGVGCEACHNGAKQHAGDPAKLPSFEAVSAMIDVSPPGARAATRAQWINRTCAKCHTVLFTRYPWTWEGGERGKNPGGSTTNSGEGRDFQLGHCASQMACTSCHDPHAADPPAALAELATPAGNRVCTGCHPRYATDAALVAHTHHKPNGAGSSCVACHLAKKNMGLGYGLVRYHRIGSPNDPERVIGDRPLECALCHADKSIEPLVATMESWWGKRVDRRKLRDLYGDLGANAMRATLARGKPHEQAVAIAVLGELGTRDDVALLAPQLAHAYPLVRYYAKHALERLTSGPVPVDVGASTVDIRSEIARWLATAPQ
ncbi:MAG: cytochrome c3 family protein [Kofleriaceae bacterium]